MNSWDMPASTEHSVLRSQVANASCDLEKGTAAATGVSNAWWAQLCISQLVGTAWKDGSLEPGRVQHKHK